MNARGFDTLARRRMLAGLLALAPLGWQARAGAQEIQFDVGEPTEIFDRSTVRPAITPANRRRGAGQRAVVEFDAVEGEATTAHAHASAKHASRPAARVSPPARPIASRRPAAGRPAVRTAASQVIESTPMEDAPPPNAPPQAAPSDRSIGPAVTEVTPPRRPAAGQEVWSDGTIYEDHYAPPGVYDEAGYPPDAYGPACCDDACGQGFNYSICNSPDSCGAPRFAFINPLVDPQGFGCSLLNRMQFRVAHSFFWTTDATLPVLATGDTNLARPPATAALPGGPTTVNLFGGGGLMQQSQSGIRFDSTYWLDDCRHRALWLRLYDSGENEGGFSGTSATNPILARPFTDLTTGTATAATNLLSYPGQRSGSLGISLQSGVEGGDLLVRRRLLEDELVRSDILWGYQNSRFFETLTVDSQSTALAGSLDLDPGTALRLQDRFATRSQFHGGVVGYMRAARDGCWYFDGMVKFGLGNMNRTVDISGLSQVTTPGGASSSSDQGLLARSTNDGVFEDDTFVIVPELSANAAYLLTRNLHFTVGYTYLRMPKVTRVGDAIDTGVNLSDPLTGALRPQFNFAERHLNVQTLDLGVQYRY